jgi:hypothetical protein
MSNEVAKVGERRVGEVQPAADLPSVVQSIMGSLSQAVTDMKADDISVDLSASQEGQRTQARFTLRAYKRNQKVLDEERNV